MIGWRWALIGEISLTAPLVRDTYYSPLEEIQYSHRWNGFLIFSLTANSTMRASDGELLSTADTSVAGYIHKECHGIFSVLGYA